MRGSRELSTFYLVVIQRNWKEILEYKLWSLIIQSMMFKGGNDPKAAFTYTDETVGVPHKLLKEFVKQSQVGLIAFSSLTGNSHFRDIAMHFEEALKAEYGITSFE